MKKQYLHLSAYPCEMCAGPVVTASVAVRENEISKETGIRQVGAICLSCGQRPTHPPDPANVRHLLPVDWKFARSVEAAPPTTAFVEVLNRSELH